MPKMRRIPIAVLASFALALALPALAPATLTEVGVIGATTPATVPSCPAAQCEALSRTTGFQVKVGKFPFSANSKASIVDAHEGFVKVVADAQYGEILGVHIIGPQATELIAEAVTAIELEATVDEMMFTIHAHPTVAEALLDGFSSVEGMAVNV